MRIAVCGAGSASVRAHLPALVAPGVLGSAAVVGICDRDLSRAQAALSILTQADAFPTLEAMLDHTAPDLLVVATPPTAHREAIATAVERGVHVLCEKPVGLSSEEVAGLEDLHRAHPDTLIATVLQYQHAPTWQRFRDAIAAQPEDSAPYRLSFSVERPGTDPLSNGGWRAEARVQGGILGDHAVHYLGLCWGLDRRASLTACQRWGEGASERAAITLALSGGVAEIGVSYQGTQRRNVIALEQPANHPALRWENGELLATAGRGRAESLSDRQAVNDLYATLYDRVLGNLHDSVWRAEQTAETIGVARLLAASLTAASAGITGGRVP